MARARKVDEEEQEVRRKQEEEKEALRKKKDEEEVRNDQLINSPYIIISLNGKQNGGENLEDDSKGLVASSSIKIFLLTSK